MGIPHISTLNFTQVGWLVEIMMILIALGFGFTAISKDLLFFSVYLKMYHAN
jgi:hypothetical protein